MSDAKDLERRLRQRIEMLSYAGGMPPPRVHVSRAEYELLRGAGYAGPCTGKIYIERTEVIAIGRTHENTPKD